MTQVLLSFFKNSTTWLVRSSIFSLVFVHSRLQLFKTSGFDQNLYKLYINCVFNITVKLLLNLQTYSEIKYMFVILCKNVLTLLFNWALLPWSKTKYLLKIQASILAEIIFLKIHINITFYINLHHIYAFDRQWQQLFLM